MKPALRIAAACALLSAVLGVLALLQSFPARPASCLDWLLLFALALPFTIAAEFVGELIFRSRVSQAVERRTKEKPFSWLRILAALAIMLLVVAVMFFAGQLFT